MGAVVMAVAGAGIILSALFAARARGARRPDPVRPPDPIIPIIPTDPNTPKIPPGQTDPTKPVFPDIDRDPNPDPVKPGILIPFKPQPEPEPKPDPSKPTPFPTPGAFYQVKSGDTGSAIAHKAFPTLAKPTVLWSRIAAHKLNAWLLGHLSSGIETGGFWPKWSGYLSTWGSGHQLGLYYIPLEKELP